MAIVRRHASQPIDPEGGWSSPGSSTTPALRLVRDAPEPASDTCRPVELHQVERTQELSRPAGGRMAVRPRRWESSLVAYFLMLGAGAAVGAQVVVGFLASKAGACTGADAAGRCVLDQVAAPALTRFALVLVCAHGLATLVLDVIPEVARRLRDGYRPRRAPRAVPVPAPAPGEPLSALAAACWAPAQAPRTTRAQPASPSRSRVLRAVCPACVTIVVAAEGRCPDCRTSVVARRG